MAGRHRLHGGSTWKFLIALLAVSLLGLSGLGIALLRSSSPVKPSLLFYGWIISKDSVQPESVVTLPQGTSLQSELSTPANATHENRSATSPQINSTQPERAASSAQVNTVQPKRVLALSQVNIVQPERAVISPQEHTVQTGVVNTSTENNLPLILEQVDPPPPVTTRQHGIFKPKVSGLTWQTLNIRDFHEEFAKTFLNVSFPHMKADFLIFEGSPIRSSNGSTTFRMLAAFLDWAPTTFTMGGHVLHHKGVVDLVVSSSFKWPPSAPWSEPILCKKIVHSMGHPVILECSLPDDYSTALTQWVTVEAFPMKLTVDMPSSPVPVKEPFTVVTQLQVASSGARVANITLGACLGILFGKLRRRQWLYFLEYHSRIVGVEHFYIYAFDESYKPFFQTWIDKGLVTYTLWNSPTTLDHTTRPYGFQVYELNVCVMRARSAAKWVAVLDSDELLFLNRTKYNFSAKPMLDQYKDKASIHFPRVDVRLINETWLRGQQDINNPNPYRSLVHSKADVEGKEVVQPMGVKLMGVHTSKLREDAWWPAYIRTSEGVMYHYNDWRMVRSADTDITEAEEDSIAQFVPMLDNLMSELVE